MNFLQKLAAWFRQPTTIAGVSTVFGTLVAILTKQMSFPAGAPVIVGGLMAMALPDNTKAAAQAQQLATDAINLAGALPLSRAQIVQNPAPQAGVVKTLGIALLTGVMGWALVACTTAQVQSTASAIATGCAVASGAEAADPAFATHNGKVVNGIAVVCTDAPTAEALAAAAGTGLGVVK